MRVWWKEEELDEREEEKVEEGGGGGGLETEAARGRSTSNLSSSSFSFPLFLSHQ